MLDFSARERQINLQALDLRIRMPLDRDEARLVLWALASLLDCTVIEPSSPAEEPVLADGRERRRGVARPRGSEVVKRSGGNR